MTEFDFQSTGNDNNRANHDFYLSSLDVIGTGGGKLGDTPLPAALPLFASGGGLLGLLELAPEAKASCCRLIKFGFVADRPPGAMLGGFLFLDPTRPLSRT